MLFAFAMVLHAVPRLRALDYGSPVRGAFALVVVEGDLSLDEERELPWLSARDSGLENSRFALSTGHRDARGLPGENSVLTVGYIHLRVGTHIRWCTIVPLHRDPV